MIGSKDATSPMLQHAPTCVSSRVNRRRCARRSRRGQNRVCRIARMRCRPGACAANGARGPTRIHARGQCKAPLACATSWPSAARGQVVPPTFSVSAPIAAGAVPRAPAPADPKVPGRSPAPCAARRPSCGPWVSRSPSVVKARPEAGSLGYVQLRKISSVPSAVSATSLHRERPVTFATTTLAQI